MTNKKYSTQDKAPFNDGMFRDEAAAYLSMSPSSLEIDVVKAHLNIPYYKFGKRSIYRKCDLDAWMATRRVQPNPNGIQIPVTVGDANNNSDEAAIVNTALVA